MGLLVALNFGRVSFSGSLKVLELLEAEMPPPASPGFWRVFGLVNLLPAHKCAVGRAEVVYRGCRDGVWFSPAAKCH